jgi:hypothetical protein
MLQNHVFQRKPHVVAMEDAKTCRLQDAKDKTEGRRDKSWSLEVFQSWRLQQIQTVEISRMELTKDARADTLQT